MLYITLIFIAINLSKFIDTLPLEFIHNNYMTEADLSHILNTDHEDIASKYEVVYLPVAFPIREAVGEVGLTSENEFNFKAFGRTISLKLKANQNLISSGFKTYVQYGNNQTKLLPYIKENCHYLHRDEESVASISICQPDAVQGLLLLDNLTFEIHPLTSELQSILKLQKPLLSSFYKEKRIAHIIRKIPQFTLNNTNENLLMKRDFLIKESLNINENDNIIENLSPKAANTLTAEVALFFDTAAYAIFSPYFNYDDSKLRNMLLAYMNGIQALYHHNSLGTNLELVLVRLDIMKNQPYDMPHYDGERSQLLNSFCDYQKNLNVDDDDNPDHWDMALYVSGLDFFAYENGRKSDVTMGLATVGGVCFPEYNCVIAELGTTNIFGKPFPSAGFTSVYILAHEIGHNLGMHHDSIGNSCSKDGYIMSPSRGVHGETQWSTCSAEVMKKLHTAKCLHDSPNVPPTSLLDHSSFRDIPGQIFTAKQQCEIFLQDKDAVVSPDQVLSKICYSLKCKTPNRSSYYYSGPALEGTECGRDMLCVGGECIFKVIPTVAPLTFGGWGPWKTKACTSGCIENSYGYQIRYRLCNNPTPVNTDRGCQGSGYDVVVCKDDMVCKKLNKKSAIKYASEKCKEFSKLLSELEVNGTGLQAPHENNRIWMACAIFCQKKDSGIFYTPRIELNDLGASPYFPDGTWCHRDNNGENYYCRQHHCLPESFTFNSGNKFAIHEFGDEIPFSQNAHPRREIGELLKQYLSLFPNGKPMQTILNPNQIKPPNEEDWETKDYIELPNIENNEINDKFVFDFK